MYMVMEEEKQCFSISSLSSKYFNSSLLYTLRLRELTILIILCLFIPFLAHSQCTRNPVVFNFGDSNSDTGGYAAALGVNFGLPSGRAFPDQKERVSDGRLILDFLCESLNASYLRPYLESIGSDFKNGVNFAIAGAATLPRFKPFSLDVQVLQFLRFRSRSLLQLSKGYTNLISEEEFKSALYTIDIGQNDLAAAFTYLSYDQVIQNIQIYIAEIKDAIWNIYKSGGKNLWIHNTGPLGCLPRELATTSTKNTSDYDPNGCLQSLNNAAKEFNNQLRLLCDQLRSQMSGATIVYVDVYAVKYDLISNAAKYGFEDPLMTCCGNSGPPYNFNANITCGQTGSTVCDVGLRYVSWDGVHYTEAATSFAASNLLSSNFSTPKRGFNFFCNNI